MAQLTRDYSLNANKPNISPITAKSVMDNVSGTAQAASDRVWQVLFDMEKYFRIKQYRITQ